MARFRPISPHDFPDRAVREAVVYPDNLRALLRRVAPAVADRLDYSRVEFVQRPYFLDDWRRRDNDVLVRLPFRDADRELLVCILIEHQSTADPLMPLRLLVYSVFFWEVEWRQWEERHERGVPLRLTPILPVVFHTGPQPWDTSRSLADLFDVPAELQAWLPTWHMALWDIQEHPVEELLQSSEAFWQALAIVRDDRAPTDDFLATLQQALGRLQTRGSEAPVHWDQLIRMVLNWSLYRRPQREHERVQETIRASHSDVALLKRMEQMSKQIEKSWGEELTEQIAARFAAHEEQSAARFAAHEERLRKDLAAREEKTTADAEKRARTQALRDMLRQLLEQRFQTLTPELLQRLEAADLEHLQAAVGQILTVTSPDEMLL